MYALTSPLQAVISYLLNSFVRETDTVDLRPELLFRSIIVLMPCEIKAIIMCAEQRPAVITVFYVACDEY